MCMYPIPNSSGIAGRQQKPEPPQKMYQVVAGDNLPKIANRYGVSVKDLLAVNPKIKDLNKLRAGEVIRMPNEASSKNLFAADALKTADPVKPSIFNEPTRERPGF